MDDPANPAATPLHRPGVQLLVGGLCLMLVGRAAWLAAERRAAPPLGELPPVSFQIDPNEAEAIEWSLLPGIGPTLAERIVADRERVGPFAGAEDLQRVHGIGEVTVRRIEPHLWFGRAAAEADALNEERTTEDAEGTEEAQGR